VPTSAGGGAGQADAPAGSGAPGAAVTAGSRAGDLAAAGPRAAGSPVAGSPAAEPPAAEPPVAGWARETASRPDRSGGLRLFPALLVALAGGLALAGAFPPVAFWPLAAVGPALLVVALWNRGLAASFAVALVFGLAFFVPLLSWLINLAWYAWAALAIAEAVIFALLAIGQRLMLRLPVWPLAVAAWWVAAEAVRARWPYAFPWGRLAMSQAQAPTVRWVTVGGPPLLTFLLALTGATLAWVLLVPGWRRRAIPALALAAAAGVTLAGWLLPIPGGGGPTAAVAAIQGNVPRAGNLPNLLRASTVTQNHAVTTEQLAQQVRAGTRPAPDVVIWPENSTDIDPRTDPATYAIIATAVARIGRPVLVGTVLDDPRRNAGQLWVPGRGPVQTYVKRQLVPFGEYIPFRGLISSFSSLPSLQPINFTPGHRAVVFHVGPVRLGDVICYEVGFDNLVASEVSAGANLLTEQTNDADFELDGQLGETLQQLAMARIRAIEFDRTMVVAGTTGVSAIIAPDGSTIARSQTWQRAILDARVPLRSDATLAERAGGWPEIVLSALAVAALAWALAAAAADRRRSRSGGSPADPQ
jgi:apolipoprotein N-acyltransferase